MTEHPLRPLLEPTSIAVVGASPRENTLGHVTIRQALIGGFGGPVYPINPKYPEILGAACYPSLTDLPEPAELAVLAVGNERIEQQLEVAVNAGAKAAVIFTNAYLEDDHEPKLMDRLRDIARAAGIPVCGANCLGVAQLEHGARATWFDWGELEPGPVSIISHSGTAYYSLAGNDPRLRCNFVASPGQELVTTASDYLDYAVGLESTRAVGVLLEAIRDPEGFLLALERAHARNIPVVALKVGQTALSARLAQSHSGALAGNDAAYEAVFEQRGVLRVQSLDEMTATLALLSLHPRLGPGEFASVHDSGGLRGMVIDLAHRIGVPFAEINAQTTAKLADTLAFGMPAVNPVDAWSGFASYREIFGGCLEALAADPATAITVLFADISAEDGISQGFRDLVLQAAERTGQPVGVALNWSRHRSMQSLVDLTLRGIPIMDGAENALLAVKHAFAYREFRSRTPIAAPPPPAEAVIAKWRERLVSGEPLDEFESGQLLSAFGVPVVPGRIAQSLEDALAAAEGLGYPVVLKTAAAGITHKSDVDGVRPGLVDPAALTEAYADLSQRLGARTLVCAMSAPGVEVALGIVVDDQFGPLVMVAAGGVLVEVLRDRRFLLPPVDTAAALRTIDALQIKPLLDGVRGSLPVDRDSLCQAIANLGVLATELGDVLTEVDVNPIIAGPNGCVAVDALVIPRVSA